MKKELIPALLIVGIFMAHGGKAAERWRHITKKDGLPGNEIQFLREREDGSVWVGTLTGLAACSNGNCTMVLEDQKVWDVVSGGKSGRWVGTVSGVVHVKNGVKVQTCLKGYSVAPLVRAGESQLWARAQK
ncbi:MAG: hypothetical protein KGZ25_15695, partial [Planctomycetes bacterium]|nr:hypothetical protein [Planctomycetota bacterium]